MTPIERIEAAIAKLEALKVDAYPGPWVAEPDVITRSSLAAILTRDVYDDDRLLVTDWAHEQSADLIVTLHRTIDAQLAILRDGLVQAQAEERYPHYWYAPPKDGTLALADAILGSSDD